MFIGVENIPAMPEDKVRHGRDQSLLVRTTDQQHCAGSHGV
jgi:hypothetical protein